MDDFLYFLVTVGFPVTGATIVLTSYVVNRYREQKFLIEKGKEVPKDSPILPFTRTAILRTGIVSIGLSFGMFAGIILMELASNTILGDDEGIAWGVTVPFFTGINLVLSYFIKGGK